MVSERSQRRKRSSRRRALSIAPEPSRTGAYSELTVPGNYPFGGMQYQEVINAKPISYEELQLMLDMDGHARGLYNAFRGPILRGAKNVRVQEARDGSAEAEFIESNLLLPRHLGGTTIPFTKSVAHFCTAFVFGFKAKEKVFDPPGTTVDDPYIRLRKLAPRDSRTITFVTDRHGGFDGFVQRTNWQGRFIDVRLPKERALYYAVNEEEVPFYGKSLFQTAYYHFDKKHKAYFIVHLALAMGALPPRMGRAAPATTPEARRQFLDALSHLGTNAAMLVPDGFEILPDQFKGAVPNLPYVEVLQHHNLEMSKSFVAQFIDVGTGGGSGGGFSLSKNHMDALNIAIENRMNEIEDIYNNHVIPELIDWNFGTGKYPRIEFMPLTDDVRGTTIEIFNKILSARETPLAPEFLAALEKEMADYLGLDVEDEAIDQNQARRVAQQQLEQAMEEANAAVGADVTKMSVKQLVNNKDFVRWAEDFSDRVRKGFAIAGVTHDPDD